MIKESWFVERFLFENKLDEKLLLVFLTRLILNEHFFQKYKNE